MTYTPSKEFRDCCLAAIAGEHEAARQVLRTYGYAGLARQIVRGKPLSNRIQRAVAVLTVGIGSEWEVRNADGTFDNDLMDPPPKRGEKARANTFDD
jgi:hypothetical protein